MASETVLVTGGAGFIGSHLVDRLVQAGRDVRVIDSLEPQVHGSGKGFRNPEATYVEASVLDADALAGSLDGVRDVVHLAAQVGVGQSMYEMTRYVEENCVGTARLLELLAERRDSLRSLVVASSMSIYGEGDYACDGCGGESVRVSRPVERLRSHDWEPICVSCGAVARTLPTREMKPLECGSVYAVSKRDQEELCLVFGRAYGVRTVALRFFNAYGPRQSLSNPYTGVAAIFLSRLLNGNPPLIFEDGLQSRDFIHVSDIVQGIERALETDGAMDVALNIGTGHATTVLDVAHTLAKLLELEIEPQVTGQSRQGDIRHCIADIGAARELLGYQPRVAFSDGMAELIEWTRNETPEARDMVTTSTAELTERGLVI